MKGKICVFFVYKLENKDIFCDNFDGVFFSLCAWLNSPELMIPSLLKGLGKRTDENCHEKQHKYNLKYEPSVKI